VKMPVSNKLLTGLRPQWVWRG